MNETQHQIAAVQVYEGERLVGTFSCRESATAFIRGEYSGAEADMLDVHIVDVPEELTK
jgi:hypothetical protein